MLGHKLHVARRLAQRGTADLRLGLEVLSGKVRTAPAQCLGESDDLSKPRWLVERLGTRERQSDCGTDFAFGRRKSLIVDHLIEWSDAVLRVEGL